VTLPPTRDAWPDEAKEAFEERAAILEFDAGLPRPLANRRAEAMVRKTYEGVSDVHR
jgi:hypothetical protein